MNSPSTQFVTSRRMGIYESLHQINTWGDFNDLGCTSTSAFASPGMDTEQDNQSEDASHGILNKYDQEATTPSDKIQRRLAQNREAARKSRLRKKAYVQQLEISRSKLIQLEQELNRARQQGVDVNGGLDGSHEDYSGTVNAGITQFGMEYRHWLEEQSRQISELRHALIAHISDTELRKLVDSGMSHYDELFRMKVAAADADVFYIMSGLWKTSAERVFSWIGGFRPSEILKVIVPQIEPLAEEQHMDIHSLKVSCQQAEDALTQGKDKLQQTLAATMAGDQLGDGCYVPQMVAEMEGFVKQADHLRQETLRQMSLILTTRQAARGLLTLGEFLQRLRDLSNHWDTRPREPT